MDLDARLARVEVTLADADVDLSTDMGGHRETIAARLWRGQVLVDWEPDPQAGGCLLRPALLRRLVALHPRIEDDGRVVQIVATGRIVAALSTDHADLVARLGGAVKVELRIALRFEDETYRGGQETYLVVERGQRVALLRLNADVRPRRAEPRPPTSPSTLPALK